MTKVEAVQGRALQVGDTIEVWWQPRRDTITSLRPYTGPLQHVFPRGAQVATFALLGGGMTIDNSDFYMKISTTKEDK